MRTFVVALWSAQVTLGVIGVVIHINGLTYARWALLTLTTQQLNGALKLLASRLRRSSLIRIDVKSFLMIIGVLAIIGMSALSREVHDLSDPRLLRSLLSASSALLLTGLLTTEAFFDYRDRITVGERLLKVNHVPE